jgi:tetratricopeptide (TPR) repeat protein
LDQANVNTLFNLALLQYEMGQTDQALDSLLKAVDLDPKNEGVWFNLIVLYLQLGDRETARSTLQKALLNLPGSQRLQSLGRNVQGP